MKAQALILVVEDDENDAVLIRRTLTRAGVPNPRQFVKSGEAAISYLVGVGAYADRKRHPLPGLVLLDLRMPGMDGLEVLRWIRQHPFYRDLRVVVLTSSDELRDVNEAYRLGANSFLVKPLEFQNVDALFATLGAQKLWEEGRLVSKGPGLSRRLNHATK